MVDQAVNGEPVILMGSSLGGYLAALYAARHANVERLVLLAPAFNFPTRWRQRFSARRTRRMEAQSERATSITMHIMRIARSAISSSKIPSNTRMSRISASRR